MRCVVSFTSDAAPTTSTARFSASEFSEPSSGMFSRWFSALTHKHTDRYTHTQRQTDTVTYISSSVDGRTVARRPGWWGGWSSALITLSSAVLPLSLTTPTFPLSPCCLYIGMSLVRRRQQPAMYSSEQVSIWWHGTGACYTDKLTFSHSSSIKVRGAYYTNVRIIFEFLR